MKIPLAIGFILLILLVSNRLFFTKTPKLNLQNTVEEIEPIFKSDTQLLSKFIHLPIKPYQVTVVRSQ
ncbi:MAG: hypothetical protein KAH22_05450, partial [Thiotrichaceae bacterium]|nr:hypothetical protein [Thiotrichaceae bacterium]